MVCLCTYEYIPNNTVLYVLFNLLFVLFYITNFLQTVEKTLVIQVKYKRR